MNINATYTPTAKELAKASSLFIEKKPFLRFCVILLNIVALIFIVMLIQQPLTEFYIQKWITLAMSLAWLLGRRPFNEWLLYKKMRHSNVIGKSLSIDFSLNGIAWSGESLQNGNMAWAYIKYVMIAQNGFLLPQSATRFLWVPFRAFSDPQSVEALKVLLKEKNIKIREYPRWICQMS